MVFNSKRIMMNLDNKKVLGVKLVVMVFLMVLATQATANDKDIKVYELKYFDGKLNSLYKQIHSRLEPSDQIKLKNSQRAWIIFRNLDCTWAFPAEPIDCMIDRTYNRVEELQDIYI